MHRSTLYCRESSLVLHRLTVIHSVIFMPVNAQKELPCAVRVPLDTWPRFNPRTCHQVARRANNLATSHPDIRKF
jgi:hypothetical protein